MKRIGLMALLAMVVGVVLFASTSAQAGRGDPTVPPPPPPPPSPVGGSH